MTVNTWKNDTKACLAGGLALVLMAATIPLALADYGSGLQLSPYQNSEGSEEVPLRGHVTTLPKGTMVMIKLDQPVSSSSKSGDAISATVEGDVSYDGQVVIPAGSEVEGSVTSVSPAGHLGKPGSLEVQFYLVKTTIGNNIPIRSHIVTADNTGVLRGDSTQAQVLKEAGSAAGITAGSTLMGTAAGSLLGSVGGGAVFGLAAGGIAGLGYAVAREGKEVSLPQGARMSIILDQPMAMN